MEADLDKFIINVSFCDCKCKLSVNMETVGEGREEVEVNNEPDVLDQEAVEETVKDDQENTKEMTSFDDLISETLICGAMIKDEREIENIHQEEDEKMELPICPEMIEEEKEEENNDKEGKEDIEMIEDENQETNEHRAEAENDSSSGYGSPELSDKDEDLDYEAFEKSLDYIEDDEKENESKSQEDILKDFFEVTTKEENFLRRRDSLRRSFHSMTDLRKRTLTSTPSHSSTLDPQSLEKNLIKDDLEETLEIGPLSENVSQCPDDIAVFDDLATSIKKGKSKLNLPVNMSIQNIKKTLLTMSPREQRKGRKGRGKRTSSMIIIL